MLTKRAPTVKHRRREVRNLQSASLTELVARARGQDEGAWTEIVHRFSPLVRKKIRDIGLSPALSDDAFQLTWLKLAVSLDTVRDPERLGGWLSVTARNEALSLLRQNWRLVLSDRLEDREQPNLGLEARLDAKAAAEAVDAAMTTLTDRQRVLVRLRYLEEDTGTYAQIAERLDMPIGAIGPTLGRALVRMGHHPLVAALDERS